MTRQGKAMLRLIQEGKCVQCWKPRGPNGTARLCSSCRIKENKRNAKPARREAMRVHKAAAYQRRKEA